MATQKQVLANQQNAQQSIGPASTEGKALIAKNALKHGVFSKQVLLDAHLTQNSINAKIAKKGKKT